MSKVVIIIQARMGSTRLPKKTLKTVGDKPLLSYLIERIKAAKLADQALIATTTNAEDDAIAQACALYQVPVFRGSALDVLDRYYRAAKTFHADAIVRITGDCPLIDPQIIDSVINYYQEHEPQYDYVSNMLHPGYPRGMDVEIFSFQALEKIHQAAQAPEEREHVTLYFYEHPDLFSLGSVESKQDFSKYRFTVDTEKDFQLVSRLLSTLAPTNPLFTLKDIVDLMEQHPDWFHLNAQVKQKPIR